MALSALCIHGDLELLRKGGRCAMRPTYITLSHMKKRMTRYNGTCVFTIHVAEKYYMDMLNDRFFTLAAAQASITLTMRPCKARSDGMMFTMNSLPVESAASLSAAN